MPSKKKKYNARFPAGRIKKIMQTDEEVGKVAQAVPVIISRTLELFVSSLLTKAMEITSAKNAKTLSPSHMKQCILSDQRFDFLKDLVINVQDLANGDDEAPVPSLSSAGNRSIRERRKSSCSAVKEESPVKKESMRVKHMISVKEELDENEVKSPGSADSEMLAVKEESDAVSVKDELDENEVKSPGSADSEMPAVKEELEAVTSTPGAANCSTLHLKPNFYTETSHDPRMAIHRPPVVVGYSGSEAMSYQSPVSTPYSSTAQRYPIPHPELSPSPVLVMDEDYDT